MIDGNEQGISLSGMRSLKVEFLRLSSLMLGKVTLLEHSV